MSTTKVGGIPPPLRGFLAQFPREIVEKPRENSRIFALASAVLIPSVAGWRRRMSRQPILHRPNEGRTIMTKLIAMVSSVLVSLGLASLVTGAAAAAGRPAYRQGQREEGREGEEERRARTGR